MAKSYGKIYQNKSNVSITPFDIYNLYPVGSIYMSVNSTNPSNYFGGTWEQIKDRFLLSCGDTYTAGTTGGEATHTLTTNEMPNHSHGIWGGNTKTSNSMGNASNVKNGWIPNIGDTHSYSANHITYVGGSQPHNNMPPYLAVYIWKRVA